MDSSIQRRFMYLFERLGEPLFFGPRGKDNVSYNVPMPKDPKLRDGAIQTRRLAPKVSGYSVNVATPKEMPNLSGIHRRCGKNVLFSYFNDKHLEGANMLKEILMKQDTRDDFLSMSTVCRDSNMINSQLWLFAFASCVLTRPDMKGFKMPSFIEICPDMFITPTINREAQKQAIVPEQDRKIIEVNIEATGNMANPENRVAYFREDIGVNSHHWHWHLIYTRNARDRDRKGELFYYMHHSMLARYNAERLGNHLPLTLRINLDEPIIQEGYFPKLYNSNAGRIWGSRQASTPLADIDRGPDDNVRIEDLKKNRDRILEAIDTGFLIGVNREPVQLTEEDGIDKLGETMESSELSVNPGFYGSLHNLGHVILAYSHDPLGLHREDMGVLGDTPTAMRDPVFYRWHSFIDDLFDKYKATLPSYKDEELIWQAVEISEFSVTSEKSSGQPNVLHTELLKSDIDLARGLDIRRTSVGGPIWARFTHINHIPFKYTIQVTNKTNQELNGTVRIFMAPKLNERGRKFPDLQMQRALFFEMDKFAHPLKPGTNIIERKSADSSVTIPWEQSFQQLEKLIDRENDIQAFEAVCGCGWPQHLYLPRGTAEGMIFDLFVMVTNGAEDQINRKSARTEGQKQGCKESISFCGILNEKYPDKKKMGFPFDRHFKPQNPTEPITLQSFVTRVPNSKYTEVTIVHNPEARIREGGAPKGMESMKVETGSPPSSPQPIRPPIHHTPIKQQPIRPPINQTPIKQPPPRQRPGSPGREYPPPRTSNGYGGGYGGGNREPSRGENWQGVGNWNFPTNPGNRWNWRRGRDVSGENDDDSDSEWAHI